MLKGQNKRNVQMYKKVLEEKKKIRQFGITGFIFFMLLGGLSLWRHHALTGKIFLGLSVFFLIMLALPKLLAVVFKGWMAVAGVIAWANKQILFTIVFFVVITPVGIIQRIAGRDYMNKRFDPAAKSYWIPREDRPVDPATYEKRF